MKERTGNGGFTLVHMFTVMAIVGVLSSTIYTTYSSFVGYLRKESRQVQLLIDVEGAQSILLKDIRRAVDFPDSYDGYLQSSSTLICKIPVSDVNDVVLAGSFLYVIYTERGEDGTSLVRKTVSGRDDLEEPPGKILLKGLDWFAFEHLPGHGGRTIRLTISAGKNRVYRDKQTVYSIAAARRNE